MTTLQYPTCQPKFDVADHHSSVSSQWLDGDEAEDEGVAEEEDEAGVAQEDDHPAAHLLATTSLFVQDFFSFLFFFFLKGNLL